MNIYYSNDTFEVLSKDDWVAVRDHAGFEGFVFAKAEAPAVAGAILQAAGVTSSEPRVDGENPAEIRHALTEALWALKRAQAIREYHAKPRLTDEQVVSVQGAIADPKKYFYPQPTVRAVLEGALEAGVVKLAKEDDDD